MSVINTQMRQTGAKNLGYKIEIMEWSNKMDLLAISNDKGEVIVYRINWQKIWLHPPIQENLLVRGLAWRPDEKIIAIGYSNGVVILLDVENKTEIYCNTFNRNNDITCLCWTQNTKGNLNSSEDDGFTDIYDYATYLPPLSKLNSFTPHTSISETNYLRIYSKQNLNFLLIGLETGHIHISAFGLLPCGLIDIKKHIMIKQSIKIIDIKMSTNFEQLYIYIETDNSLEFLIFENDILPKYSLPILNLSVSYRNILGTMSYISDTIQGIIEAWETVLLEMDNKLTKYANSQPEGSVSGDFLELLMFGYPSPSLEHFLTKELTEKGLKKLGNSIELSYSTIQKLVIRQLHCGILNICYYLNTIVGMGRNSYYYKPLLGTLTNESLINAYAFMIKAYELQQTIDQSTRNYKIFFRWLFVAIIRLMDETIPEDISTVTQQEINYLAEFLYSFDEDLENDENSSNTTSKNKRKFNLERVGQYLEDSNLIYLSKYDTAQHWSQLFEQNECLRNSEFIYPNRKEYSLIQELNKLKHSINDIFNKPQIVIGNNFRLVNKITFTKFNVESRIFPIYITHINIDDVDDDNNNKSLFAILETSTILIFKEINPKRNNIKTLKLELKPTQSGVENNNKLTFRHIQFYNEKILSILFNNTINGKTVTGFLQFSIDKVRHMFTCINLFILDNTISDISYKINAYDMLDINAIKLIDGIDGHKISVSGTRKVASLISESLKRIRLYYMEIEEDDDDIDASFNNSLDTTINL